MALETSDLHHRAILWEFAGKDGDGQETVRPPVRIKCRYDEGLREAVSDDASPIAISHSVPVDRDIPIYSIIRLLEKSEWDNWRTIAANPNQLTIVVDRQKTFDVKGRNPRRSVSLQRYGASLPAVVSE